MSKNKWDWDKAPLEQQLFQHLAFIEGLGEQDSPADERSRERSEVIWQLLEGVRVDVQHRQLIWPEQAALGITASVHRIQKSYPAYSCEQIESSLLSWLECGYVPQHDSQEKLDELDQLICQWLDDHESRSGAD